MSVKPGIVLKRSKSLSTLYDMKLDSSFEDYSRSGNDFSDASQNTKSDVSKELDADRIGVLGRKVDSLNVIFQEQSKILSALKDEIQDSEKLIKKTEDVQNAFLAELLKKIVEESDSEIQFNSRARSLLDAIEAKRVFRLDHEIRDTIADFLQSDKLIQSMVSAATESVRNLVKKSLSREFYHIYLPVLQRSQRRLNRRVTRVLEDGFTELEANLATLSNRITRSLDRALSQHLCLLEAHCAQPFGNGRWEPMKGIMEEVLQQEMSYWRRFEALDLKQPFQQFQSVPEWVDGAEAQSTPPKDPNSPLQDPDIYDIDQLMNRAHIKKLIADGDFNGSFEQALIAEDLSLVVAACRAADPTIVFSPRCKLEQTVLLSLAQQLATDMVQDTLLKCRYIEEAIINLNPLHPATQAYIPLVVSDIRKNLTSFLVKYPNHTVRRRITLIIMAVGNLLK